MSLFEKLKPRSADEKQRRRFGATLDELHAGLAQERADARSRAVFEGVRKLVRQLRPSGVKRVAGAIERLQLLTLMLREDAKRRAALSAALMQMLEEKQFLQLFTDAGILPDQGFFTGLWERLTFRLLPEERHPEQMRDTLAQIFDDPRDYLWIEAIDDECWIALLDALSFRASGVETAAQQRQRMQMQMLEALQVLSYRVASLGLSSELVRAYPAIERYESPFMAQSAELRDFLEERKRAYLDHRAATLDDKQLLVLLGQCDEIVRKIWKQSAEQGTSVSLTAITLRLSQSIDRLKALLALIEDRPAHELNVGRVRLFKRLVRAENRRNSVKEHWSQHLELLASRVTHHASKTGEHYITSTRAEYWSMFKSSMGAGFIVAFMALNKFWLGLEVRPPLVQATLFSLNYGLGFVLIYLLRFTIATKQPAMTASHIAQSLDHSADDRDRLDGLAELCVRTARSQFIAVVGNVVVAFIVAVLVGTAIVVNTDGPLMTSAKAQHLLGDASPWASPAIFHAAIAGVCLFLAGLIAGYYDNKAVYARVPQRLQQVRWLGRLLGAERCARFAHYVGANLGGISGNFFLGCMLGSVGTIGLILGLPLDIRHITFATANVAYGLVGMGFEVPRGLLLEVSLGILAIGFTNLVVSFTLALYVALRAQRVRFNETGRLLRKLVQRFLRTPGEFFFPPSNGTVASRPVSEPPRGRDHG